MADVPIPFTGQEIDTDDDATSIGLTVGVLVAGFALFSMASATGQAVADRAGNMIADFTGYNPAAGQTDSGVPGV